MGENHMDEEIYNFKLIQAISAIPLEDQRGNSEKLKPLKLGIRSMKLVNAGGTHLRS
jgi:hypothetical protein